MKLDTLLRHDRSGHDERAVSEILGAIFVFALIVMVLALVQLWAVPAANQQTEFDHNQRALADMQSFASDVDRAAGLGTAGSSTVEVGPQYSTRMFLLNPPAPAGTLETADGTIRIENVRAVNTETADYIDGNQLDFDTRSLVYRPNYNEYANAPTTRYEGWTLYNDFEGTNVVHSQRSPISGNRISLIALDGTQSTSAGGSLAVPTEPISGPSRTISVQSSSRTEPLNITITTGLDATEWADILADEMGAGGRVQSVEQTARDQVTISLEAGHTYGLRMAKVGIGSGTTEEGAHYLTTTEPRPVLDDTGGTVSVSVHDRFNNPVPGVEVTFASDHISFDESAVSDEDGLATARFSTPSVNETTITATADVNPGAAESDRERVVFADVPVTVPGSTDTGDSEINPDEGDSLKFVSSERGPTTGNDRNRYVDVAFDNTGSDKTITAIRVNAYISNTFSGSSTQVPDQVDIDGSTHEIGGVYEAPTGTFQTSVLEGDEPTYRFEFRRGGAVHNPDQADFFVYSIQFADGTTSRYFVQMDVS